jgi:hypothetical protein
MQPIPIVVRRLNFCRRSHQMRCRCVVQRLKSHHSGLCRMPELRHAPFVAVRVMVIGLICLVPGIFQSDNRRLSEAGSTLDQEPTRALIDSHKFSGRPYRNLVQRLRSPPGVTGIQKSPTLDHLESVGTCSPFPPGSPFTGYQGDYASCSYKCLGLHPHWRRAK